ncbi:GNAT family N-acetyltransferase [uncultured Amnibacterium sp.]|uniref:GNAT family N-acetyltransferase n=1 Tax=uncultured Amnibacterium sp. TaxID=1631851 RepID=UPI0035C95621
MPDRTRPLTLDDAPEIARLQAKNRAFLAPWDAIRPDVFYTVPGQRVEVQRMLEREVEGTVVARAILDDDGLLAGVIRLNGVTRGAFESCAMGYWVDQARNGQGLASGAVAALLETAFGELRLHRVQAETLRDNVRSQRVLARNGFEHIGMAPRYMRIAGEWQDHELFQRLAD